MTIAVNNCCLARGTLNGLHCFASLLWQLPDIINIPGGGQYPVVCPESILISKQVTNRIYLGFLIPSGSVIGKHSHFFGFDNLLHYMDQCFSRLLTFTWFDRSTFVSGNYNGVSSWPNEFTIFYVFFPFNLHLRMCFCNPFIGFYLF